MAQKNELEIKLPTVDSLFSSQAERDDAKLERVLDIPINQIVDFPNHPFKVRQDKSFLELVDSIRQFGVLSPALVRPAPEGGYQMVSGHRRKEGCLINGIQKVPCIIRNLSYDEAVIVMVNSNIQRDDILPSERAFAYEMELNALKRQGKRWDLTSSQVGTKLRADEELAQKVGESRNQVHRWIRLTKLIPEILDMVDNKKIAFNPAVELSYLMTEEQKMVLEAMEYEDCTPSVSQAKQLKQASQKHELDQTRIYDILHAEKSNQKEKIVLKGDRFEKYFSKGMTPKQKEDIIFRALEDWYRRNRKKEIER